MPDRGGRQEPERRWSTESADVLYHLIVLWVASGVEPEEVWAELQRREGVSGIAEKAARMLVETRKIP